MQQLSRLAATTVQRTKRDSASIMPRRQQAGSPPTDDRDYNSENTSDTSATPARKRKTTEQSSDAGRPFPARRSMPRLLIDKPSTQLHCNQQQQRLRQLHTELKQQQELLVLQQQQLQASQRRNKDLLNIIYALVAAASKQKSLLEAAGGAAATAPPSTVQGISNNNSGSSSRQSTHSGSFPGATAATLAADKRCRTPGKKSDDVSNLKPALVPTPLEAAILLPAAAPHDAAPASAGSAIPTLEGQLFAPALAAVNGHVAAAAAGPTAAAAAPEGTQEEQQLMQMLANAHGEEDLMQLFEQALQPAKQQKQKQMLAPVAAVTVQQQNWQLQYLSNTRGQFPSSAHVAPPAPAAAAAAGTAALTSPDLYASLFLTQQQQQHHHHQQQQHVTETVGTFPLAVPKHASAAVLATVGSSATELHAAADHMKHYEWAASATPSETTAANIAAAGSSPGSGLDGCSSSLCCLPSTAAAAAAGIANNVAIDEVSGVSAGFLSDLPSCTDLLSMLEDLEPQGDFMLW